VAEAYVKPYADSSLFIAWLKGEVVLGVDGEAAAERVLEGAEQGRYVIATSALTLAEVHKLRTGPSLPAGDDDRIIRYFEHRFFEIIDVDRRIGEHANRLCRAHGIYPNDAIHLASALRAGCDVLLAWDDRFARVREPGIRIIEP
jgi:predicted nucleic acid-binding protein